MLRIQRVLIALGVIVVGVSAASIFAYRKKRTRGIVLVACGSYSPITKMHVQIFEDAKAALEAQGERVVKGILSPVHDSYGKVSLGHTTALDRVAMCSLAVEGTWIEVDIWEVSQHRYTRTLSVLRHFQEEYPECQVRLLSGMDLVESFSVPGVWEDPGAILREFGVVAIARTGSLTDSILDKDAIREYRDKVTVVMPSFENTISSSTARYKYASRDFEHAREVVPSKVHKYIMENELYRITDLDLKQQSS